MREQYMRCGEGFIICYSITDRLVVMMMVVMMMVLMIIVMLIVLTAICSFTLYTFQAQFQRGGRIQEPDCESESIRRGPGHSCSK